MKRTPFLLAAVMSLVAAPAFAHTGVAGTSGLAHGFMHPIGGFDHVLAMVAVGLLAAQQGGRAVVGLPAAFIAMMVVGFALGMAGFGVPMVETGILASVIVLGAVIMLGRKMVLGGAMALVGAFAVFHGFAHGMEMPAGAGGLAFGAGFVAASMALHVVGIALGFAVRHVSTQTAPVAVRASGCAIAVAGLALIAA